MTDDGFDVLDVSGDAYACGEAQGRPWRGRLREALGGLEALPLRQRWMPPSCHRWLVRRVLGHFGRVYLRRHRDVLAAFAGGRYLAQLEGLAAGHGVSVARIYGFHALEVESARLGYQLGCTALAFAPDQTADGRPKLAYNHDFPPSFRPFLCVRRSAPRGALRSIGLTYATTVGAICGVNEAGVAATVNQAFATDIPRRPVGVLVTILVQAILDTCEDVAAAVALLAETPVTNGSIVTLVDAAGERAVVELSATRRAVRRAPPGRVLQAFNQYLDASLVAVEVPVGAITTGVAAGYDVHACNLARQQRFDALARTRERFDDAAVHALLADHDGGPGDTNTICAHGDAITGETIASALLDPVGRSVAVLRGAPCRGRYRRIDLGAAPALAA